MFHNTHTYFASKLCKSHDNLLLLGSILPDIAVTGIIKWEGGLHGQESLDNLSRFIKRRPAYLNLYKGIHTHNIIDDFAHTNYIGGTGYAYQNNEELVKLVAEYYDLDKKGAQGKAHNYIESGVDILLLQEYPHIPNQIKRAIQRTDEKELSRFLGSYFNIDKNRFLDALLQFFDQFTKYDLTKEDNWNLLWADLENLLSLKNIGNQKRKQLIQKSITVVKNTYHDFLKYSLEEGSKKLSS